MTPQAKALIERMFKVQLDEISSEPVQVTWAVKNENGWYGDFIIDGHEYNLSFTREDKIRDLPFKTVSFKFDKPSNKDPHAYSFEFIKPAVVKATVIKEIKNYIRTEMVKCFVIKAYSSEESRVKKYRNFSHDLKKEFGFSWMEERVAGKYTYFILIRGKEVYDYIDKLLKSGI